MKKVKLRVGDLIAERGVSQSDVSKATGLQASTVSKYSNGYIKRFDQDVLNALVNYFHITDMNDIIEIVKE